MEVMLVSRTELKEIIVEAMNEVNPRKTEIESKVESNTTLIRGIKGLAAFLNVSVPTAQKMKNDKIFPCIQRGRIIFFKSDEVLSGLSKRNRKL